MKEIEGACELRGGGCMDVGVAGTGNDAKSDNYTFAY